MPHLHNPEAGFIATANNKPTIGEQGVYLGRDWIEYRHTRIVDLLAERVGWDLDTTQQMQLDQYNIPWGLMKPVVLDTPVRSQSARTALDILKNWDGVLRADSKGGAVYEFFVVGMLQRMAKSKAPNATKYALDEGFHPLVERSFFTPRAVSNLIRQMRSQPEGWFKNGWESEIEAALVEAIEKLEARLGPDPDTWSWGAVHGLVLAHPLGIRPPLDKIFNRGPYPTGGDYDTISQAGRRVDEFGSNVTGLANLRAVHDVGNWDESRFVIAGGQSGNPCSPHYDDLLRLWLKGENVNIAWTEEAVVASTRKTLTLIPKNP
jgi:penicillin amidase